MSVVVLAIYAVLVIGVTVYQVGEGVVVLQVADHEDVRLLESVVSQVRDRRESANTRSC